ncbi:alpha/beta hydrolase [Virgibacillus oceani]
MEKYNHEHLLIKDGDVDTGTALNARPTIKICLYVYNEVKKIGIQKLLILAMIIFGALFLLGAPYKAEQKITESTVFVHGYKGTFFSFGFMLHRFENVYEIGNKILIYYVGKNGEIQSYRLNNDNSGPQLVHVIFEDNRTDFEETAGWLADVLASMKSNYAVNSVNLVGHSMGGIVSLKYAMQYQSADFPAVNKIVALGAPFGGIFSQEYFQIHHDAAAEDLKPDSAGLQLLETGEFPENTKVLNLGSTGDSVAVVESVKTLNTLISEDQIEEIIIEDDELGHSALHQSEQIDKIISSFLWQDDTE